jgi:hypothetical protein
MLKKIKSSIDNITKSSNDVLARFGAIDSSVKTVPTTWRNRERFLFRIPMAS